jgi:hypothetical protein
MHKRALFGSVFLFLIAASPAVVRAQFQAPTDEELKMTSDPKAPGAAAVYLSIEEIDNDPLLYKTFYARIKVLAEKGEELATVEIPYLKYNYTITNIKGRTIHSDGTVIPLVVKPSDLLIEKTTDWQVKQKTFSLPSVEVGSILEYQYDIAYPDHTYHTPYWEIQKKYFVHKAHYVYTPPNFSVLYTPLNFPVKWAQRLPTGVEVQKVAYHYLTLDVTDVAAAPNEEWMPPLDGFREHVIFYYNDESPTSDMWVNVGKRWSNEVNRFAEPSKAIHEAVNGLIAPGDGEMDKARKLYAAVQALDNTDYSRKMGKSERKDLKLKVQKRAEDTWAQKSGSSEDIALLYLAMLRAAGLTAYAARVVDRDRSLFDPDYISLDQFSDTLVILSTGGNEIFLDPGEKMCPFKSLNWKHSNTRGLRQSDKQPGLVTTPIQTYAENSTTRAGEATVDGQGGITGSLKMVMTGQEALRWRQTALENDETEMKKLFDEELERLVPQGVEAHVDHFTGLTTPDTNLMAVVNLSGTLGTATPKRDLLPGFFFETRGQVPFVSQEKRLEPVDMHYGEKVTDQMIYHLPAGLTVEAAPPDANIAWTGHASFITRTKTGAGQVLIARSLARAFTEVKPEEYQDLRGFYAKVAAADQQQLVLTLAPNAKGN